MMFVGLILLSAAGAVTFALQALDENMMYFVMPSDILADSNAANKKFRLGGMVKQGSVQRAPGSLEVHFTVFDSQHELPVTYTGVLPDLFREGQTVIAHGRYADGVFNADEINAKHDENYMPAEVAERLAKEHGGTLPDPKP